MKYYVNAVLDDTIKFQGVSLISSEDLLALHGVPFPNDPRENWLSNFVIDEYLSLLRSECPKNGTSVETLLWEIFDKGVGNVSAKTLLKGKEELLLKDAILVPCSDPKEKHWVLLAVFPKKKLVMCLDSLACDFIKPTSYQAIYKMASLIKELNNCTDINQWKFAVNKKDDLQQQTNAYDRGVFTCLYASCLVNQGKMIDDLSIHSFRKLILLDLHQRSLHPLTSKGVQLEHYYAVDYVSNYYIRRVLMVNNQDIATVKFLHRVGASRFDWPKSHDVDEVHVSCLFYGPIELKTAGPFEVPQRKEIEKLFKMIKKEKKLKIN